MVDAELGRTPGDRGGRAAADERDGDAARAQQLDGAAVLYVEGFDLVACIAVDDAAVGEHAVDVEAHQRHETGALEHVFRKIHSWTC